MIRQTKNYLGGKGADMDKINENKFITQLIIAFPEIKEEVLDEDYRGHITMQVGCFRRLTQHALDNEGDEILIKCFGFVADWIDRVEFRVENSLTITWLGKLNFEKNKNAYSLLSPELQERYTILQNHYSAPLSPEVKNFLDNIGREEE